MKRYISPHEEIITLHHKQMIASTTQTDQGVYTDDPQDPINALVKDQSNKSVWDEEW